MKKLKNKLDEYHYHEALDRAYIVANQIEAILIEHPVIKKHKKLRVRVKTAQKLILEVYQLIGGLEVKLFPDQSLSLKNNGL